MLTIVLIGYVAGLLTTFSLVPEIYRTWRIKEARDLSYYWLASLGVGVVLWIAYGIFISSMPVIAANSASIILVMLQALLTVRYNKRKLKR